MHTVRHTTHTPCAHTRMHMYQPPHILDTYILDKSTHYTHTHTWMGTLFEVKSWNGQRKTGCAVGVRRPAWAHGPGYTGTVVTGKLLSPAPSPRGCEKRPEAKTHFTGACTEPTTSLSGKKGILEGVAQHWLPGTSGQGPAARHKGRLVDGQGHAPDGHGWRGSPPLCPARLGCGTG